MLAITIPYSSLKSAERTQFFESKRDYRPETDSSLSKLDPDIQRAKDLMHIELKGAIKDKNGWRVPFFNTVIFSSKTEQACHLLTNVVTMLGTTDRLGKCTLEMELAAAFERVKLVKNNKGLMALVFVIYGSVQAVHKSTIGAMETYKKTHALEACPMLTHFQATVKRNLEAQLPSALAEIPISYLI